MAILGAFGGLVGLGLATYFSRIEGDAVQRMSAELEEREEAGQVAHAALTEASKVVDEQRAAWWAAEQRAVEHRASELALLATLRAGARSERKTMLPPSWKLRDGEAIGLVDLASDRIVSFSGIDELTEGATLSVALPVLTGAMQAQPRSRAAPLVVREGGHVWGVGTAFAGALFVVARVPLAEAPVSQAPLERAVRAVGNLAAPAPPVRPPGGTAPWMIGGVLLGSLLAALWVQRRWTSPLRRTLDAARGFAHGEPEARADEEDGGRDARDVARAVNALIERAVRLEARGRAAREEDVAAVASAIDQLGQGDLRSSAPPLGETFAPIAGAVDHARRGLLERVSTLHDVAADVASTATDVRGAAKKIRTASTEQRDALHRLSQGADETTRQLENAAERLKMSTEELRGFADDHRRSVRDVRASLRGAGRRLQELSGTAARIDGILGSAARIDAALGLLSELAHRLVESDAIEERTRTKISTTAGDARAAVDTAKRELTAMASELATVAEALEATAAAEPESVRDVSDRVTEPLHYAASTLARTAELAASGLRALERSARTIADGAGELEQGVASTAQRVPELSDAFKQIRVGASFEDALIDRLERAKAEVEARRDAGELTDDGRAMVDDVRRASEDARVRLAKLIEATEQAAAILRS